MSTASSLTEIATYLADSPAPMITIYVDGACSGNPGPGGWGAACILNDKEFTLSGGENQTTNNRMELKAAIESLKLIPLAQPVTIYTDSQYVKNGITSWILGWKKNNWVNSKKEPVKNKDLWVELDAVIQAHEKVQWEWVKGHSGNPMNEKVDMLAKRAIIALQMR